MDSILISMPSTGQETSIIQPTRLKCICILRFTCIRFLFTTNRCTTEVTK
jgi:hypothetical protein